MARAKIEPVMRLLVVSILFFSSLPSNAVLASPARYAHYQAGEGTASPAPTATETASATATETDAASPTGTAEATPTETADVIPTETLEATVTATVEPSPTETAETPPTETATIGPPAPVTASPTLSPTATASPEATATATALPPTYTPTLTPTATATAVPPATPTFTPTATVTLTPTATFSPTATATATPTALPEAIKLSLTMQANPGFVSPGEPVTVTLTLSNPAQLSVETLTISATLPAELGYDSPLGGLVPGYNPLLRLLSWQIPPALSAQEVLTLGYVGRVAVEAPASALSLMAEISSPQTEGASRANAGLIILPGEPVLAPQPGATPGPAGPPARVQLGLKAVAGQPLLEVVQKQATPAAQSYWLAVSVADAEGRAVADGTEVVLSIQGGQVEQNRLWTGAGVAATRFSAPSGQVVSITARAGQVQGVLELAGAGRELAPPLQLERADYGEATEAVVRARNAVRVEGQQWVAENPSRRVAFSPEGLSFQLKKQGPDLKALAASQVAGEGLSLGFELNDIRVGQESQLSGHLAAVTGGNWVSYEPPGEGWQMGYEVGEATVEQYFVFEEALPAGGDLVIEGLFETTAQPLLLSDEAGLRFVPAGASPDEVEETGLGYGPALVEDARGRRLTAHLELTDNQVRIRVPGVWLARAEYPVVVDPVIGPAGLVSSLHGEATDPVVASDGSSFLTVWSWQGDIYGQLVAADGSLSGELITISQAEGLQSVPDVVYNPVTEEYLVVWKDQRYGLSYGGVQARRLNAAGQPQDEEIELVPPRQELDSPAAAVATSGPYLLVWRDRESGSSDIYGQLVAQSGVISGARLIVSDAAGSQRDPAVGYDSGADVFLVIWEDHRTDEEIYGQRVAASGALLGSNQLLVSDKNNQSQKEPAVAGNGNGQFLVSWERDYSSGANIHAVRVSATSGQVEGAELDIDTGSTEVRDPVVAGISGNRYLVVWQDDELIEGRQVDSAGNLGPVLTLRDLEYAGSYSHPAVAHGGSQSLGVWSDGSWSSQEVISGRRVADTGTGSTSGEVMLISPYYSRREEVAVATGQSQAGALPFLLIWQQAQAAPAPDIFSQRVDSQGQANGPLLNLTGQAAVQERAELASGQNGYLAVWQDWRNEAGSGSDIYGHLLDASGALSGTLITITTAISDQIDPAVAYNSQRDEYLVLWSDYRNGGSADLYGQLVGGNGNLGANPVLTVSLVSGSQKEAAVAYNVDTDRYLAVWRDHRNGNYDIYGQVISADGSLAGPDIVIVTAPDTQEEPALAYSPAPIAGGTGVHLVVWEDRRDGLQDDLYGQLIGGSGVLSGSNFAVSTGSDDQRKPAVAGLESGQAGEFLVVWEDRRLSVRDIYGQRVGLGGQLLDEPDTTADETDPAVNFPLDDSSDNSRLPAVVYNPQVEFYLVAWNSLTDGGIYARRYSSVAPPPPTAGFTATPTGGVVPLTVTFSDSSTGTIATRAWDFGDGTSLATTGSAPFSHTYLATGTFGVVLTATNPGGSDTAGALITVTARTTPSLTGDFETFDLGHDPTFWLDQAGDTTTRDDFKVLWSEGRVLGTGYTDSEPVYSHYAIPGWAAWQDYEYEGRLKLEESSGELGLSVYAGYPAGQATGYVLVQQAGTGFRLMGVGSTLRGETELGLTAAANSWYRFRLQAVTHPAGVTLRARVWAEGETEPAGWQAVAYDDSPSRLTAGAVGVRAGGSGRKYVDDLVVTPLNQLVASFGATPAEGLAPLVVSFSNLSVKATAYAWDFGDGSPASLASSPVHTYTGLGVYTVTLKASNGPVTDTLSRAAVVVYQPVELVQVGESWRYFKGTQAPPAAWAQPGFDDSGWPAGATGIGYGDGDDATVLADMEDNYLTVFARRVFTVENPAAVRTLEFEMDYDDGFVAYLNGMAVVTENVSSRAYDAEATASHEAGTAVVYDLSGRLEELQAGLNVLAVQGHNNGLSSSDFSLIPALRARMVGSAPAGPQAGFTAEPLSGPAPLTVTFTNHSSNAGSYLWDFGDGTPGSAAVSPTHTYTQGGLYMVSLAAGDGVVTDTLVKPNYITVSPPVTAAFSAFPRSGPAPLIVLFFDNSTNASNYLWDFGDGLTGTISSPVHTYTQTGAYTVSLTAGNGILTGTLTRANYITVTGPVVADFSASPLSGSVPLTVTFTNSSTGATGYRWDFGDGTAGSTAANPGHVYLQAGSYTVTLSAGDGVTTDTLTRTNYITVSNQQAELIQVGESWRYFKGTQAPPATWAETSFDDSSWPAGPTGIGYGDGDDATVLDDMKKNYLTIFARKAFTVEQPAAVLALTFEMDYDDGFVAYLNGTAVVTENVSSPAYNAPATTDHEAGTPVVYDLSGHLAKLQTGSNVLAVQGHNVRLTDNDFSLIPALGAEIGYVAGPEAAFGATPLNGPAPLAVTFTNSSSNASSYVWDFGDGLTGTVSSPVHTYTRSGIYTVSLTVTGSGGMTDTLTRPNYITVSGPVAADFSASPLSGTVPLTVTFVNSSTGASSYLWDFGDGSSGSIVISPTHIYTRAGIYTVTLVAGNGLVTDTLSRTNYITVTSIIRDWRRITTTISPPVVGEQAMAYDSAGERVVLYGGNATGWPYEDSTWEFDGTDWSVITTTLSPVARYGAGLAYDSTRGTLLLFGGSDETDTALNQSWEYTNTTWVQVAISGTIPASRTYHSLAADPISGTIYLFGGNDGETYYNDLWRYENGSWTAVSPLTGTLPAARSLAALVYDPDNDQLLLFGGRSITGTLLADLWAFDPVSESWTELDDGGGGGGGPPGRMAHTLTYDPATGNVVLVGGATDNGDTLLGETWHYRDGWTEANPTTALPARAYHQTVYTDNVIILFSNGEVWGYE